MTYATVFSFPNVIGWEGDPREFKLVRGAPLLHSTGPLIEVLNAPYDTDAHFVPYALFDERGEVETEIPRLKKRRPELLAQGLATLGATVHFGAIVLDIDAPKNGIDLETWRDRELAKLADLPWIDNAGFYETRGGYRLLWELEEDIVGGEDFEAFGRAFREEVRRHRINPDELSDWTRIYRLPHVPRYEGFPSDFTHLGPLDWTPPKRLLSFTGLSKPGERKPRTDPSSVVEGGRHSYLKSEAGRLRNVLPDAAFAAAVRGLNASLAHPLDEGEVDALLDWFEAKDGPPDTAPPPPSPRGPTLWRGVDKAERVTLDREPEKASSWHFDHGSDVELAEAVLDRLEGAGEKLVAEAGNGSAYGYDPALGIWTEIDKEVGRGVVRSFDRELVPGQVTAGNPSGICRLKISQRLSCDVWKMALSMRHRPGFFDAARRGVAFINGFFDLDEGLIEHSSSYRSRHLLPFDFDTEAQCPRWDAALASWTSPLGADAPEVTSLLAEFVGASLFGIATHFARALLLYGQQANNGKSQFLAVVEALFPPDALASVPPQAMDDNTARADLYGARLNIVSEMPEGEILRAEGFKAYITGDRVRARQVYREGFSYRPEAGHLFAANRLPAVQDTTLGFWRRWLVVPFLNSYLPGSRGFVARLADEIIEAELPGVAMWAVRGALRVRARGAYLIPQACASYVDDWRLYADQVASFVADRTTPAGEGDQLIGAKDLFRAYESWALEQRGRPVGLKTFARRLSELGVAYKRLAAGRFYGLVLTTGKAVH